MMKPFLSPETLLMSRCVIFDSNVFQVPDHSIPPATPSLKQSMNLHDFFPSSPAPPEPYPGVDSVFMGPRAYATWDLTL